MANETIIKNGARTPVLANIDGNGALNYGTDIAGLGVSGWSLNSQILDVHPTGKSRALVFSGSAGGKDYAGFIVSPDGPFSPYSQIMYNSTDDEISAKFGTSGVNSTFEVAGTTGNLFYIVGDGTANNGVFVRDSSENNIAQFKDNGVYLSQVLKLDLTGGKWLSFVVPSSSSDIALTLPSVSATLATTAELGSYLPLAGGTLSGDITAKNITLDATALIFDTGTYNGILQSAAITDSNKTWTLPNVTGTIALTSDLSSYLPLAGGTMSGPISFTDTDNQIFRDGDDLKFKDKASGATYTLTQLATTTAPTIDGVLSNGNTAVGENLIIQDSSTNNVFKVDVSTTSVITIGKQEIGETVGITHFGSQTIKDAAGKDAFAASASGVTVGASDLSVNLKVYGSINLTDNGNITHTKATGKNASDVIDDPGVVDGVAWHYVVKDGSGNMRAGSIVCACDGTNAVMKESTTIDIGDTSGIVMSISVSSSKPRLYATITAGTWAISVMRMAL